MVRILILLIIAFLCGSIGSKIAGATKLGCLTSIALGFIGALIGEWISRDVVHIPDIIYFKNIPILWSIIGAAIFVAVINLVSGGKSRKD